MGCVRVCDLRGNRLTIMLLFQAAQLPESPQKVAGGAGAGLIRISLGEAGGMMMERRWQALGTEVWPADPVASLFVGRERGRGGSFRNPPAFWTARVYSLLRACSYITP